MESTPVSSVKRIAEAGSSSEPKKIKLSDQMEIPDDIELVTIDISEDESVFLTLLYDDMYEDFYACLKKESSGDRGGRRIMLTMNHISSLTHHMEKIELLFRRYENSGRCVSFSFDLGQDIVVKLASSSLASLDVRKYFTKEGKPIPTKTGVRLGKKNVAKLATALVRIGETIEEVQETSSAILSTCRYVLLVKEISLLHGLNNPFCDGCKIQHPSQREHMGEKGCMSDHPPCWSEMVDYFFKEALEGVDEAECLALAEKYCQQEKIPLIRPSMKDETASEIKAFLLSSKSSKDSHFIKIMEL